jgi:hypothetical protein
LTGYPDIPRGQLLTLPIRPAPVSALSPRPRPGLTGRPVTVDDDEGVAWAFWKDRAGNWYRTQLENDDG